MGVIFFYKGYEVVPVRIQFMSQVDLFEIMIKIIVNNCFLKLKITTKYGLFTCLIGQ